MPRAFPLALLLVTGLGASCREKTTPPPSAPPPPVPVAVSYNDEVRPLLASKCFPCHGANEARNQSGLRLDSAESATTTREASGATPVVPGNAAASSLLQKLLVLDPEAPTDPAHTVTAGEHEILQRWIAQGARYEPHWAFQPLSAEVPVPERDHDWPRNAIDQFVLQELVRDGRQSAPPVDHSVWLRRATLDLTGLPPTEEELQAFAAIEPKDAAIDLTIDRLLANPPFGQRMAALWLQAAGYADTGDEATPDPRWRWRDWVVEAFNANLPANSFLRQQLAGDLLPDASRDETLATAFLRLDQLDKESASPPAETRVRLAGDRVDRLGQAIPGLELRCARCHQHPVDPLTPTDHAALAAFFPAAGESGQHPADGIVPAPTLLLPTDDQIQQLLAATEEEGRTAARRREAIRSGEASFREWLADPGKLPLLSDLTGAFSFDGKGERSPNQALGHGGEAVHGALRSVPGIRGSALQLDGSTPIAFPTLFALGRCGPWTITVWLRASDPLPAEAVLISRFPVHVPPGRGLSLALEGAWLEARLFREWPGNAIAIRCPADALTPGAWHHLAFSYDGSSSAAGLRLFLDGRALEAGILADHLWKQPIPRDLGSAALEIGAGGGLPGPKGWLVDDLQVFARALTTLEIGHLHDSVTLTEAVVGQDPERLRNYYFSSIDPEARRLAQELHARRLEVVRAEDQIAEVSVMRDSPSSRGRAVPALLPPFQPADPSHPTRLDLADWLLDPAHPLAARAFVNRIWAAFFGKGLVEPLDGFGLAGAAPARPALLDWLTRDFLDHGWDVKRLCRQIVSSATYRQSSATHRLDPLRRRDLLLAASGLLEPSSGGPPQPGFRRALYTPWQRPTGPTGLCPITHPEADLPAPAPAALTEVELLQVARALATRTLAEAGRDDAARLTVAFRFLAGRTPTIDELAALGEVVRNEKTAPSGAVPQLIRPGQTDSDPAELALWTSLCRRLLDSTAADRG